MLKKEYKDLFIMIVKNGQICGENAIEAFTKGKGENLTEEDKKSLEQTQKTISVYQEMEDKILNDQKLEDVDYGYLYMAAVIAVPQLERNISRWTAVLNEYQNNLIPNLERVISQETVEDKLEKIAELFEETFNEESQE